MTTMIATLAVLAGLMPANDDSPGQDRILEPLRVIECADLVSAPVSVAYREGRLYLLDPLEQVVVAIAERPDNQEDIRTTYIDLPTPTIHSMFFGCGDVLYLLDPMERALFVQEADEPRWRRKQLDYRVFYGAGDAGGIMFNADRHHGPHLVTAITCRGDTTGLGRRLEITHPFPSVAGNLNYIRMGVSSDLVAVGHIALGTLLVYDRGSGGEATTISLTGPEVVQMRRMYLLSQSLNATGRLSVERDTLVADLVRAARPGRFPIPVYVNDLTVHMDMIWSLCNNTLQIFDRQGVPAARWGIGGEHHGEQVVIHRFCITAGGRLYGLDTSHYRKIYDFGPVTSLVNLGDNPLNRKEFGK